MVRRVFYVIVSAYMFVACFGLLVIASDWLGGSQDKNAARDDYTGLWPLPPVQQAELIGGAETNPGKPGLGTIQTNAAAIHAGEKLIQSPPPSDSLQTNTAVNGGETPMKWPNFKMAPSDTLAVHEGETLIIWLPTTAVQTNTAAVHQGETLIKWPPPAKVVQTNTAAVHAGEKIVKWPRAKMVQSHTAAVHAGETLIKWPKAVQTHLAAVHAGETLINWPPAPKAMQIDMAAVDASDMLIKWRKAVQINTAAVHQGETLIKLSRSPKMQTNIAAVHAGESLIKLPSPPLAASAKPKPPSSKPSSSKFANSSTSAVLPTPVPAAKFKTPPSPANISTGAVTRQQEGQSSKILRKAERPDWKKINREASGKSVEPTAAGKAKPTTVKITKTEKASDKNRRRTAKTTASAARPMSRPARAIDSGEVRRAVEQLNDEDRRAFRSRCGQILSAPRKFARANVEICTASL